MLSRCLSQVYDTVLYAIWHRTLRHMTPCSTPYDTVLYAIWHRTLRHMTPYSTPYDTVLYAIWTVLYAIWHRTLRHMTSYSTPYDTILYAIWHRALRLHNIIKSKKQFTNTGYGIVLFSRTPLAYLYLIYDKAQPFFCPPISRHLCNTMVIMWKSLCEPCEEQYAIFYTIFCKNYQAQINSYSLNSRWSAGQVKGIWTNEKNLGTNNIGTK